MSENAIPFSGAIPENYDAYLGPVVFEPFAIDLADRIDLNAAGDVLELACGTGRLTRYIAEKLPAGTRFMASDLQEEMLIDAQKRVTSANISWAAIDMQQMALEDERFDLALSQFGVMLVPDKPKSLGEIHRVLKPGGQLFFSVWGDIEQNDVWKICGQTVSEFIGGDPILRDPGPFSMQDKGKVIEMMTAAGFSHCRFTEVKHDAVFSRAAEAARGFVRGLPIYVLIRKKDPALVEKIEQALEQELIKQLGDRPMKTRLTALVFEGTR